MLRVLMVLEDYGEMMFLQTVLKKTGFDVDAIQNPRSFTEGLLRMNPDILVMTAFGKRVRGFDLVKLVTKIRGLPRIVLLRSAGQEPQDDPSIDLWLETPVAAPDLLKALSGICRLDDQMLQEKFQKLQIQEIEDEETRILRLNSNAGPSLDRGGGSGNFGILGESKMSAEDRRQRFQKFLSGPPPPQHGFARAKVQDQVKDLRRNEGEGEIEEIERERRAFVDHLFRKK